MKKTNFTVECDIKVPKKIKKQKSVKKNEKGRIPRISKLMALAIHFEQLVKNGKVKDYADIARLGYVSRARLTQIMNLNLLAPDIQEKLLYLQEVKKGNDPVTERQIRLVCDQLNWSKQIEIFDKMQLI